MSTLDPLDPTTLTTGALVADETALNASLLASTVTLALAQQSKAAFVDGIFNALRQAPIAYTASAGAFDWDATDESVNALAMAAFNAMLGAVVAQINGALAAIITDTNNALTTIASETNTNFAALGSGGGGVTVTSTGVGPESIGGTSAGIIGSVSWFAVGRSTAVTLTGADVAGLIGAIAARRATLQAVRALLQTQIAACSTVAAVIAISASSASW